MPPQQWLALMAVSLSLTLGARVSLAADAPAPQGADGGAAAASDIENSVVKVFSTVSYPDLSKPWTKAPPSELTGSGVVIDGKRILTNAHVVLYASQIQVQANQAGDKIGASVIAVAPGIDLAVLKLDDVSFFDTHAPAARSSALPQIKDSVLAYGYPTGGTSLSITKGIVSRIEFMAYNYPVSGLRIQIDAAINPGNSGGPAISEDRMIGLAFSRAGNDTQNIGYIIPNEEIDLFLQDIADGHYDGKPAMYDEIQTLENPSLRAYLKIDKAVSGVVVHRPAQSDPAYPLKEWDVITHIADTPIDDQGMVRLGADLRIGFKYRVQQVAQNGKIPLTIIRAGKTLQVQLPVPADEPLLIPDLRGQYPSYFVYGPLVFSKASTQYLSLFSKNSVALAGLSFIGSPLITQFGEMRTPEREELVVVASPMFPDKISKGYDSPVALVLNSVNGTRVRSLAHLVSVLRDLKDDYVVFEFQSRLGEALVFDRKDMLASTEAILADNGLRARGSVDMMAVWQGKAGK